MATEARNTNYWVKSDALYVQLNAMGEPNYIQCSVVSGASIIAYMQQVKELGYDAGHNYQRWTLQAYPSQFPDDVARYVYAAIPRQPTTNDNNALVVFPSERIDLYGKAVADETRQVGNEAFYYIFLQGIISEVKTDTSGKRFRDWTQHIDYGTLATDEALASGGEGSWWQYNSVSDTVSFLKTILKATFDTLTAKVANISKLILGDKELNGIATEDTPDTSEDKIVTPHYMEQFGVKHWLAKDKDDTAQGLITFLKGLNLGNGGTYHLDADGAATLKKVILSLLQSVDYDSATETGFGFTKRRDGKYKLELTDLMVWGKAIFNNLEIRELSYVGGNIVLSPAASKVAFVREVYDDTTKELTGWKTYLLADDGTTATLNMWQKYDQVRCETFNIKHGVYQNVSNKLYWRLVTDVSTENEEITDDNGNVLYDGKKFAWIFIAKNNCLENSDTPAAGDTIVLMGNRRNTDRQHILMMETEGDNAPRLVMYHGVNSYSLTGKYIFKVGIDGITAVSQYFKLINTSGDPVKTSNYRGVWVEDTAYGYYDEVTWMGTRWLCLASEGETTTDEPSEDSAYWQATTAIVKTKLVFSSDLSAGISRGETHTVTCYLMLGDKDVTSAVNYWAVERKTDDSLADQAWALKDKVVNFKGTIEITWANDDSEDDLGSGDVATFTFTAKTTTGEVYKATLQV